MCVGIHVKYPLLFSDVNKFEFCPQIYEKYSNLKLHEICLLGAELFRADRHDEANSRISLFCECA